MLLRYSLGNRCSIFSVRQRSSSTLVLSKLAYHSAKNSSLKPFEDENSDVEINDEQGIPKYLTTLPITKRKHHTEIKILRLDDFSIPIKEELFISKCNECKKMVDFTDVESDVMAKKFKTSALKDFQRVLSDSLIVGVLTNKARTALYDMLSTNLLRPIPPVPKKYLVWDEEPLIIDVNWTHLQLVYPIIISMLTNDSKNVIHHKFRRIMVSLLNSADPNEREQIIAYLTSYIDKYPDKESTLLIEMSYLLIQYKDNSVSPFSVSPILKFYKTRVSLMSQITQEFMWIYNNACLPLITTQHVATIYQPLMDLIEVMSAKDDTIVKQALKVALSHWPETKASKQICYLNLLSFLIENVNQTDFSDMCASIFRLYAKCALTQHAKVVDTSFKIWQSVKVIQMIMDNTKVIYPIVYPVYSKVMKEHWRNFTQDGALSILKQMHDLDPFVFDEVANSYKRLNQQSFSADEESRRLLHKNWATIARAAAKSDRDINLAKVLADIQMKFSKPHNREMGASHLHSMNGRPYQSSTSLSKPKIVAPATGPYRVRGAM